MDKDWNAQRPKNAVGIYKNRLMFQFRTSRGHRECLVFQLKRGPSDLVTKIFTKILKKTHPYTLKAFSFSFIKLQLSKAIRQQEKLEIYYGLGLHRRESRSIFTWAARSFTYWKHTDEASNKATDENIMENNCMFVILWNLSVISHWIFPQCFFFTQNLEITSEAT